MIRLEKVSLTEEEFKEVYDESFDDGYSPLPRNVFYVFDEDKRVAFCSVYIHGRGNLYLQFTGFTKDVDPGKKYGYYIEVLKALHDLGFPFIMGAISNKNNRALMWALRSGFEINGTRQATNGELFVEVLHRVKEN